MTPSSLRRRNGTSAIESRDLAKKMEKLVVGPCHDQWRAKDLFGVLCFRGVAFHDIMLHVKFAVKNGLIQKIYHIYSIRCCVTADVA